jgi:hypothetical protein
MEDDKWIIQYKVKWMESWLTDSVVSDKMEALHRASFLLTFEHNDVRIITPDNEVIQDHDEGKLL